MRALVTGGSGFIGRALVRLLAAKDVDVVNYDLNAPMEPQAHTWIRGDVLDLHQLKVTIRNTRPNLVFHLAAKADISSNRREEFRSIDEGTRNVVDAISGTAIQKFIHVSTQLVVKPGSYPKADDVFEPYTTYGEAKADAEVVVRNARLPIPWAIVRPTNIWGPFHPSFSGTVWKYLAKRWYLHPTTASPVVRCYGFVDNSVYQMWAIMNWLEPSSSGRVFYLADHAIDSSIWLDAFSMELTGQPVRRVSLGALSKLAASGDCLRRLGINFPLDSGRLHRMTTSYFVPLEPLFDVTGAPIVGLQEGVRKTVTWLRSEVCQRKV